MLKSMRSRMTMRFVLLLIPFLVGTSYMVVMISSQAAEADARKAVDLLKDRAVARIKTKSGRLAPDWKIQLEQLAEGASFRQAQAGIMVRDRNQEVLYASGVNKPPSFLWEPREKWPKDAFDKFRASRDRVGPYSLSVIEKRKPIDSTLPTTLTGLSFIVIIAAAVGTWFMVGRVLSPIRRLAHQAETSSAAHLTAKLEPSSQDAEMVDLVDTLNGLLDRVYQEVELKGQFYAAASHELRTPLQALSGHLELALSRQRTAEEYEAVVKESYTQARRLISLTQSLLFLHQIEGRTNPAPQTVNLSEACENSLEMTYSQMMKRNLKVEESLATGFYIEAIPSHAEVLARNLIENAAKYTTEGGTVKICLEQRGDDIVLEVVNDFPSEIKIATQNIFQPFYRDDTSRNSKTGGNGLGLAICKAITVANGWEVELTQVDSTITATVNFGPVEEKREVKKTKKGATVISKPAITS